MRCAPSRQVKLRWRSLQIPVQIHRSPYCSGCSLSPLLSSGCCTSELPLGLARIGTGGLVEGGRGQKSAEERTVHAAAMKTVRFGPSSAPRSKGLEMEKFRFKVSLESQ